MENENNSRIKKIIETLLLIFGIYGLGQFIWHSVNNEKMMQFLKDYHGLLLFVGAVIIYLVIELLSEISISRKQRKGTNQLVAEVLIPYVLMYGDEVFKKDLMQMMVERKVKLNKSTLKLLPPDVKKLYTDMENIRVGTTALAEIFKPQIQSLVNLFKNKKDESDRTT